MTLNRFLAAAAASVTLAMPAAAFDVSAMTDGERSAFGAEVRAYLMENPQVIIDAVNVLEQQQAMAQVQADQTMVSDNADAIFDDGFSFVGGNPDGDITLVEFLDYKCGYCKRAHGEVAKLLETDGNIRLIVKEFPILGEQSLLASRFAISTLMVEGPDAYHAVTDALMTMNGDLSVPVMSRLANTLGYDADAIAKGMDADEVTNRIAATRELAQRLQITGTPTFVMHDEMLRGYLPYDQMMQLVDEKRG
ncbi:MULTISPECIES: DsbA family protein [Roseobacteraceae]|uniref:Disulfide bond formation protein D n=1 Tax=Pseudosulfitobacter pseudonitzschiae TaxID=1402135 RepID=A0A221JZ87_9RHOB|nr:MULTISPECIES: DsbA family protein [Roseobacteraceae]ASM72054.1 disulfide bond formation protein D [Pseudosulfitobacter pseudonitzschiae]